MDASSIAAPGIDALGSIAVNFQAGKTL